MTEFHFTKMHGAGNDFIMGLDTPENRCPSDAETIRRLCDRRRGIGADGAIWITPGLHFSYWNADGSRASLCGNGLRCAMEFAVQQGIVSGSKAEFSTDSGKLTAERLSPQWIRIQMPVPQPFRTFRIDGMECYLTHTGVPHTVVPVPDIASADVQQLGSRIRNAMEFGPEGTNVDFLKVTTPDTAYIRTYERGVEGETLACGTGITAAGAFLFRFFHGNEKKTIFSYGGDKLSVELTAKGNILKGAYLTGPAKTVFSGTVWINKKPESYMEK